ncbi:MAG TPA: histidine phosphatase family protein [Acidimicrobiales bacterium]|nr:histidine phosphatase family protein [Acidimicrobiales bacterium]
MRHGKTPTTGKVLPGRVGGLHLSDEGRAQAEAVAQRIAGLSGAPVAVYASPLERTRETAAPIARALGLRVRSDAGLLEADVGRWAGVSLKRLYKTPEWPAVQRWPSGFRFPGGESFTEMSARANDAVVRLAAAHRGATIVVVSHADPIKAIVASACGTPLDLLQRIVVSPCSVSAVAYGAGTPLVLCVNSTADLTELEPS